MQREKKIIQTSILGIIMNLILVAFKMMVGLLANSIAIILDAVNNLSDAMSSVITIVGTKLAAKAPDTKHPYGYGRIEYITSTIIAVLVLMAGVTSIKESVVKIIHPQQASYQMTSFIIIAAAVVVKFAMGNYVKKVGEELKSGALVASGTDALFDCILSLATLVTALVSTFFHIGLEGWIGAIISCIIMKAGFEMLSETMGSIIGTRVEYEVTNQLKARVKAFDGVNGAYDVTLHNYGPSTLIGSVHIEVDDDMDARQIHALTRKIIADIHESMNIILTVGIYATNLKDPKAKEIHGQIGQIVKEYSNIVQFHGFYLDEETKTVTFDLVIDFEADAESIRNQVRKKLQEVYPAYHFGIAIDTYFSD